MRVPWLGLTLILCLAFSGLVSSWPARASEQEATSGQGKDARELKKVAHEIRSAVLRKDIESLLKYDLRGEQVRGIIYDSYTEDKKQLQDRQSLLYCYLFDTACLQEIASRIGAKRSPFLRMAVYDFFSKNKRIKIEVLFWPPRKDYRIASVLFLKPSFRMNFAEIHTKGWPLDHWGNEFIAADFILVQGRWKYYEGIFKVAINEGDIG